MRKKRLAKNTFSSLTFQIATILCGFILPRLILQYYGSEVNGLINSISQFLSIISFMELGMGAVVRSSLYKPLADQDMVKASEILASARRFFNRLGQMFLAYIAVLVCVYPMIAKQDFGWLYSAILIVSMSISSLAQYYSGMVDRLLLTADQRGYIYYTAQTITLILNTAACVALIQMGATIHAVKLTTSLIYLIRPLVLRLYVDRHYQIDRHIQYKGEPIKQKWNGIAQHVASVILNGTDSIVLTIFASLSDVSIYSVYHLVVNGVAQLMLAMTNGVQALMGELWAKQQREQLEKSFGWFEWVLHTGTTFVFGCTGVLILPFVQVYTHKVSDANYLQPLFAVLIVLAYAGHCLRLPYNIMILAAGHYKQTQSNYIISAGLNVVISVTVVWRWGLVGVAVGTLAAMLYQTVWMAWYNSRNLLCRPLRIFFKQVAVDGLTIFLAVPVCGLLPNSAESYVQWILLAVPMALIWLISALVVNALFYREKIIALFDRGLRVVKLRG